MYPYITLDSNFSVFPVFGESFGNKLEVLSMDNEGKWFSKLSKEDIFSQERFQALIEAYNKDIQADIIISEYLENREYMFKSLECSQMVDQKRFFHLGVDITAPKGSNIYAPIDGIVYDVGYEEGKGNYGGYIVLEHTYKDSIFYSLYGHLDREFLEVEKGQDIQKGYRMSRLGDFDSNGGYFHHLHLQVVTQKGKNEGFLSKGYCTQEDLKRISYIAPNPNFLFRY